MRDLAPGPHDGPPGRSIDAGSPAEVERAIEAIAPLDARWWQNPDVKFRRWLDPDGIMPLEATQPEFEAHSPTQRYWVN